MMAEIPVTQYMRPHGKKVIISIERPKDIYSKAKEILNAGYLFEIEVLTTGQVSLTITDGEEDICFEVADNVPGGPASAFDRLVLDFYDKALGGGDTDER